MAAYSAESFQEELAHVLALQPDGWLMALLDERPVGVGGVVNFGPFAYIGLIGTLPELQRRGIGQTLTTRLLTWLESQQCPIALLEASQAGEPLYTRLGFQAEDTTIVFQATQPVSLEPSSIAIEPFQNSDPAELIALDVVQFGANRSRVLSSCLTMYPERCFVSRDAQGHISGYIMAAFDGLGPWLAQSHAEAEALLARALRLNFSCSPRLRVPASNQQAVALARAYGFRELRTLKHMRRGGTASPQKRENIYALASAAIG
jgi:ribosomal protein S18 acetylase RimI-like enzyme